MPFDHFDVICGQGTTALEIDEQLEQQAPDILITPVGGGGLLGCSPLDAVSSFS